jgi:two-component system, LytTR family, sensor kinase
MINPIFKKTTNLIIYVSFWIVLSLVQFIFFSVNFKLPISYAITDSLVTNMLFCLIGISLWFMVLYSNLNKNSLWNNLITHLASCVVILLIWISVSYILIISIIQVDTVFNSMFLKSIPWRIPIGVTYYIIITLSYYLIIYYENFKENIIKEADLKTLLRETELKSLKSQINPHFLFNSLNSISSLTLIDPSKAHEMIIKLSDFMRYSLKRKNTEKATVGEELDNARRYLDIEKIRFGNRLKTEFFIDETCLNKLIPNLVMQPLLENAIKYGVFENTETTAIEIHINFVNEFLKIAISNSYNPGAASESGEGIGQSNIKERLRLIYNRTDLMKVTKGPEDFQVVLYIPQNEL